MAECNDPKCPIHGQLKVRGGEFLGRVVSAKAAKSATVERQLVKRVSKYERHKKIRSKVYAYNPECISAKEGDTVKIGETRKLSKTKSFAILEIVKSSEGK